MDTITKKLVIQEQCTSSVLDYINRLRMYENSFHQANNLLFDTNEIKNVMRIKEFAQLIIINCNTIIKEI